MRKLVSLISTLLILVLFPVLAFAQSNQAVIPEKNGDYPDPEHPGVRVRVFVHEPKSPAPSPTSSPVLSCTDPDSASLVNPAGWKLPTSTWTYNLNTSSVPSSVGSANLPTISSNGFTAWSNALASASAKPVFARGSDTTTNRSSFDNQNIISWGRTSGTALAVTYVRYYTATGLVADVDTIFNKKFAWNWTDPTANTCSLYSESYDAQDILTHEQGHWLGLDDEYLSSYVDNTMYGYGNKGEVKKDTLTTGDINGIKAIYP